MRVRPANQLRAGIVLILASYLAAPAFSYLNEFTGRNPNRWNFSEFQVQWNLNPNAGSNVTGLRTVADVVQASFNTWTSAPNATLPVTRGADSSVNSESNSPANINLICFVCSDGDFSKDSETLAVTITTTADQGQSDGHGGMAQFTGQIIKADILFNPADKFSTDATGSGQDLQTIATHEIGHFFGLDHSAVVGAVMFPFAAPVKTTLSYDDVAGISNVYPKSTPDFSPGSISGIVNMAGTGAPLFGVHVYAGSTTTALPLGPNIRKSPIGVLTRPDGSFNITGLPADSYIITAEPLDGPVDNSNVPGYGPAFGAAIQTGFTTRWH
jgi:hypothetical protein